MSPHRRVIHLEAGVPIEATEVRRVETPDGPMHVQRPVVIQPKRAKPRKK